jgi:pullulanase
LPLKGDNEANWGVSKPRLADPSLSVGSAEILAASLHMNEVMQIRNSSKLFRMQTAGEVIDRVAFHNTGANQTPGLIVMSLSDDSGVRHMVLFNVGTREQSFTIEAMANKKFKLHPVQKHSHDRLVRQSSYDKKLGSFTVPARTTAVFIENGYGHYKH